MQISIQCPKLDVIIENDAGEAVMTYHIENYSFDANVKGLVAAALEVAKEVKEQLENIDGLDSHHS